MLNAKLTATGRHSVRLSPPLTYFLFLMSRYSLLLSLCCRSIVILFPHFRTVLFWTNGETKKRTGWIKSAGEREREREWEGGERKREKRRRRGRRRARSRRWRWKRITSGSPRCISMNLKLFFVRVPATDLHCGTRWRGGPWSTYVYIPILKDVNRKNNFCPWVSQSFPPADTSASTVFLTHWMNIDWQRTTLKVFSLHC